jgi:hypothetical protein
MESPLCEKPERHASRRLSDHLVLEGRKLKVHSLVDKVYSRKNLKLARERVCANQGASGADKVTIEEFEACLAVRFSNRPFGVKRFQTIRHHSVDVARGLVLLFGISTTALPSWVSRTRWNNLKNGLAVRRYGRSKQTDELISSIVPRGTSFHRSVELEVSPIVLPGQLSCHCEFSSPTELGAVNPYAVHDHGQPTRQRHDRLLHPAVPGDLHRPGLEP